MFKQITVVKNKVVKRTLAASGNSALPAWATDNSGEAAGPYTAIVFFFQVHAPFRVSGGT